MKESISIFIIDDHKMFLQGITKILTTEANLEVLGGTDTAENAFSLVKHLNPDVIIMDLDLPDMSGLEATKKIRISKPQQKILILTWTNNPVFVEAAVEAKVDGYLLKDSSSEELVEAIKLINEGKPYFGTSVNWIVIDFFQKQNAGKSERAIFPELTEREFEILDYVAAGLMNNTIAEKLSLSEKTIRNNISNIYRKLEVTGRGKLIVLAQNANMGSRRI